MDGYNRRTIRNGTSSDLVSEKRRITLFLGDSGDVLRPEHVNAKKYSTQHVQEIPNLEITKFFSPHEKTVDPQRAMEAGVLTFGGDPPHSSIQTPTRETRAPHQVRTGTVDPNRPSIKGTVIT